MFESEGSQQQSQIEDAYAAAVRERDWIKLHEEITSVGKQIVSLEAREVDLLLEAEETRLYRRMGFPTIYAYIEAVLQHSHHVATERIRVAHELLELPSIAEQFRAGELPWTSVRELTRVVTAKTEGAWLDAVDGKTSTDVQQLVRGKSKGDLPGDPVDPKKVKYRIVLDEVSAEVYAMFKQARIAVAETGDGTCTNDELVRAAAMAILRPAVSADEPSPPVFQTAVTTCRACKRGTMVGAGLEVELSLAQLERAQCDAVHIGDLESDAPERLRSEIPEPTRRKVFMRDKFQCAVPGCRSCRYLDIHHVVFRSNGGGHELSNLVLLCDGHHKLLHDGVISIRGTAPDALVFDLPLAPSEN